MKKRLLMLALATLLAFGTMTACGDKDADSKTEDSKDSKDKKDKKGKDDKDVDIDDMLSEAEDLMDDEEYEDAIDIYLDILDEDDECVEAYLNIADCYMEIGKDDKAEKILSKGIDKTDSKKLTKKYDEFFEADIDVDIDVDIDDDIITSTGMTLEDYYSQPDVLDALNTQIESTKEEYKDYYSDIYCNVYGNTFEYVYVFDFYVNPGEYDTEAVSSSLESATDSLVNGIKNESGVTDEITVIFTYLNNDYSELLSYKLRG